MKSVSAVIDQAATSHRRAAALLAAAGARLDQPVSPDGWSGTGGNGQSAPRPATGDRAVRELAERLRAAAALLAPGWQSVPLDAVPASTPLGAGDRPDLVRIGTAYPLDDASFPVVVPLGHLACDGDARDRRVAGVLRAVVLRLLASVRPGSLLVRPVDPTGSVFAPFAPLNDAGIMSPPVTDLIGLRAVLTEAEQWLVGGQPDRTLLVVIAGWPRDAESDEFSRLLSLAGRARSARLHLLVAGWPPPPLTGLGSGSPLPDTTQLRMHNPYVMVGHPPGGSFASQPPPGRPAPPGLSEPVYLDPAPSPELVSRVCTELADRAVDRSRLTLGDLLPVGPLWQAGADTGLEVVVGHAGDAPARLRLADPTPHWLLAGRSGSGRTAFLHSVVYGLCSRYDPDQLSLYLLDLTGGGSFTDFVPQPRDPSYLPHARAVGVDGNRHDGLAVLRGLARQLARRRATGSGPLPRLVCLLDGVDDLLAPADPVAAEAGGLLTSLARQGGPVGIHLVLATRSMPPADLAAACRVRIALPGGGAVLDVANQAAAGLATGTAIVNTAGGLGGPRGATRAHEQLIRFPDPRADQPALAGLRHRFWRAGDRNPAASPGEGHRADPPPVAGGSAPAGPAPPAPHGDNRAEP